MYNFNAPITHIRQLFDNHMRLDEMGQCSCITEETLGMKLETQWVKINNHENISFTRNLEANHQPIFQQFKNFVEQY